MKKTLTRALALLAAAVLLYAGASLAATFTLLADAADRLYPGAGQPVFWALALLALALALYPVWLLLRLPRAMTPPPDPTEAERRAYEDWLRRHLGAHPDPEAQALAREGDVAGALAVLGRRADALVRQTAGQVFVSTALLQNGRLDGLVMLGAQLRLVWQVAALYRLRPTPGQLWYLYSNVAGTMLLATNLEDIDFAGIASPIVHSVAPSVVSAVPGLQAAGGLLVNSMANGCANAFLTLRVGLIAKAYCAPLADPQAPAVRQSATVAALGMLSAIVGEHGTRLSQAVWTGATGAVGRAAGSVAGGARRAAAATTDAAKSLAQGTLQAGRSAGQGLARATDKVAATAGSAVQSTSRLLGGSERKG
mgnify:CR=1 FL=1